MTWARNDDAKSMWFTPRSFGLHATIVVLLPAYGELFAWQVRRVEQGNSLSWAYVFEWPFFAGYSIYLWWNLVHDQPDFYDPVDTKSEESPNLDSSHHMVKDNHLLISQGSHTSKAPFSKLRYKQDVRRARNDVIEARQMDIYNEYLEDLDKKDKPKQW